MCEEPQEIRAWTGEELAGDPAMSMAIVPDGDVCETVVVAGAEDAGCTLAVGRLKEFLKAHHSWTVVATNAAQFYSTLVDELKRRGREVAEVASLLGWRLLDVEFFEQRLRYAREGRIIIGNRQASPLASEQSNLSPMEIASTQARETHKRYLDCRAQAETLLASLSLEEAAKSAETLGVVIDVQGAIAAQAIEKATSIKLRPDYAHRLRDLLEDRIRESSQVLRRDAHTSKVFSWEEERPRLNNQGSPRFDSGRLNAWLESESGAFRREGYAPLPPELANRKAVWAPDNIWTDVAACRPVLRAWVQLNRACRAQAYLRSTDPDQMQVASEISVIPRLNSIAPDWEFLNDLDPNFLAHATTTDVLVVELHQLHLRCWAATCRRDFDDRSQLADLYAAGDDPVASFAETLREAVRAEPDDVHNSADDWKATPLANWQDNDARWQKFVAAMLWAISHGMTMPELLEPLLAQDVLQGERIRGQTLLTLFQRDVYPETYWIFADHTLELVATRLGSTSEELFDQVSPYLNESVQHLEFDGFDTFEQVQSRVTVALRIAIDGKGSEKLQRAFKKFIESRGDESLVSDLQSGNLRQRLLARRYVSSTGHVGPPSYVLYNRVEEAKEMADEIRKCVAYLMVSLDWPVLGIMGDRMLIDLTSAKRKDCKVTNLDFISALLRRVLGDLNEKCPKVELVSATT